MGGEGEGVMVIRGLNVWGNEKGFLGGIINKKNNNKNNN